LPEYESPEKQRYPILWAGPVLVSNKLIVVSSTGYAESVSPYTGRLLGRVEIPDGAYIAPIVANGTLYIYTNDAELVALR
jgi:outer membrane protein assembly factor BamB